MQDLYSRVNSLMVSTDIDDRFVHFSEVEKTFDGKTRVVKDLNLEIARGEFMTLLGPSGSGKTTCLLMLAGFETLSSGDILINGKSVGYTPPQKRNIGVVFQSYALFPHMTLAENIAFPLNARGLAKPEIETRTMRALQMVRLDKIGSRLPGQISGGQQQRVALARALVFEPSLVLMDEPLGALDKQLREEMQYEIMHLQRRLGITAVYVTHDQSEALTMSDRIAVFNEGRIQQLATPKELYEAPGNVFVASFVGENNRLNATVVEVSGSQCTVLAGEAKLIRATAVNIAGNGSPTTLSIRPERVALGPAARNSENCYDAIVNEIIFHGDHLRVSVTLCGQPGFIIKIANGMDVQIPACGETVSVGWATADCRALDARQYQDSKLD